MNPLEQSMSSDQWLLMLSAAAIAAMVGWLFRWYQERNTLGSASLRRDQMLENARREADLVPDDRIILGLAAGGDLRKAITRHESLIKAEVLATRLTFDPLPGSIYTETVEIQGENMEIMVGKG